MKDAGADENKIVCLKCFAQDNEQSAASLNTRRPAGESLFMVSFTNQLQSANLCFHRFDNIDNSAFWTGGKE
jgi:hypothetical protein